MNAQRNRVLILALCVATLSGCGAARSADVVAPASAGAQGPAPEIKRSLFARSPQGRLSEEKLQEILAGRLELELPARVGVLPIVPAEDWRGPGPDYSMASAGLARFSKTLPSDDAFTLVTEMMPIPSGALGMEALREMAARYKLRYIVLYRENVERKKRVNGWATGYVTILGSLFLPGSTLSVEGYVEASLFDVKTGLLMFTVRRRVAATEKSNLWHRKHKMNKMQARLSHKAGIKLAADLRKALFEFRTAVAVENKRAPGSPAPRGPMIPAPGAAIDTPSASAN